MFTQIFNPRHAEAIGQRIQNLQPQSQRQWGTMSPAQMCWHCRQQLEFVLNPEPAKIYATPFKYEPMRWLALYLIPWGKGLKTAPEMNVDKQMPPLEGLEAEREKLLQALQAVLQKPKVRAIHPLFGNIGRRYWGRLIWKHLDHHLRQFSC